VGHAERSEDVVLDVVGEGFAADALDDVADHGDAVVGVGEGLARRGEAVGLIAEEVVAEA